MGRVFGGLGGVRGGRPRNPEDDFESALDRACGERMRADDEAACQVWCALSNVDWSHEDGDQAGYSFRAAGDLVAAIVGKGGDYMDYYCRGLDGVVEDWIAEAMKAERWSPAVLP